MSSMCYGPAPMTRLLAIPMVTALTLCACANVDYVELEPASVTFKQPNEKRFLEAKCMSRAGQRNTTASVTWSVKDAKIASVDSKGEVKPLASGLTEVIARYSDSVEARALVNVLFTESISVEPKSITVTEGAPAVPVKVTSLGFDGRVLEPRKATMVSKDAKIAQIVNGNSILGLDPGSGVVVVSVDGKTAEIAVVVEAEKKSK